MDCSHNTKLFTLKVVHVKINNKNIIKNVSIKPCSNTSSNPSTIKATIKELCIEDEKRGENILIFVIVHIHNPETHIIIILYNISHSKLENLIN